MDEFVRHTDRYIEVVPAARRALGRDELVHIGMVNSQHAHLGAAAGACALHRGAGLVKHVHVAARARRHRRRGLDPCALGPDAREVVAHTTAAAHGFGGLAQGLVDARETFLVHALNAVAHGLHKAVDQCGLDVGACGAHDAARANRACLQVGQEQRFVFFAQLWLFDRRKGPGHALVQLLHRGFARFEVFLAQHVQADGLDGAGGRQGGVRFALHGVR
ncbi:hypothetical protein D3C71_1604500 [compost metagenome]